MPGLFDDIPATPRARPSGMFDDIPATPTPPASDRREGRAPPVEPSLAPTALGGGPQVKGRVEVFGGDPREDYDLRPPIEPTGQHFTRQPAPEGAPPAELRPYEPTWRDQVGGAIAGRERGPRQELARRLVGSSGLGREPGLNLAESAPLVAPLTAPLFAQEAKRAFEKGNTFDGVVDSVGALLQSVGAGAILKRVLGGSKGVKPTVSEGGQALPADIIVPDPAPRPQESPFTAARRDASAPPDGAPPGGSAPLTGPPRLAGPRAAGAPPDGAPPAGTPPPVVPATPSPPPIGAGADGRLSREQMRALHREEYGVAARRAEIVAARTEPYYRPMNSATPEEINDLIDYAERRSLAPGATAGGRAAPVIRPDLQALADEIRDIYREGQVLLQRIPESERRGFIRDYYPHMYEDNDALRAYMARNQGTAGPTHAREAFRYWSEARDAGLTPRHNFIDMAKYWTASVGKYVAAHEVRNVARDTGTLRYARHPWNLPDEGEGWSEITGRFARGGEHGELAGYMPAPLARDYNNWISEVWRPDGHMGTVMDVAREVSNASKAVKFGFSGYHLMTTALETNMMTASSAFSALFERRYGAAAKDLLSALGPAPAQMYLRGRKANAIYRGVLKDASPEDTEIVDLLTRANAQMAGAKGQDFQFSKRESIFDMARRGSLAIQARKQATDIRTAYAQGALPAVGQTAKTVARDLQLILDASSSWLFRDVVPNIKSGMAMKNMGEWLKANPGATQEAKLAAARRISDYSDNVLGETMEDNLFQRKTYQDALRLLMLSPTYFFGSVKSLGKGVVDVPKKAGMTAIGRGKDAPAFSRGSEHWSPEMGYALGTALVTAWTSALITVATTGKPPEELLDYIAPPTGGTVMRSDGKGGLRPEKERYSVPGSPKEVLGGLKAVGALGGTPELFQYFAQKLNSPVTFALDVGTNSDWRGDPVFGAGAGKWAMDLLAHAWEVGKPIMFDQGLLSPKPESNIPFFARALGARAAGMDLSNPEGYRAFMDRKSRTRDAVRESHERTEALKWATPEERAKLMREGAAKKLERAKEMKRLKAEERARQLKELGR